MQAPNLLHILIQGIAFLAVYFALSHFVFKPILRVLAEREKRMVGDRDEARDLVSQTEERIKEYEEKMYQAKTNAKEMKNNFLKEALKKEREILGEAREESSKIIAKTREKMLEESKAILPELKRDSEQIARKMAQMVLGREV